jgi:hypothetical protein
VKKKKGELADIIETVFKHIKLFRKYKIGSLDANLIMINARLEEIVRLLTRRNDENKNNYDSAPTDRCT